MKNIKMIVAYDGGGYLGWQNTRSGPSIEATLQGILEKILQEKITLQAASRTDAGVHAVGQVVNFFSVFKNLDVKRLHYSLNSLLPKDITVREMEEAPITFHPTIDSQCKEYRYYICYDKLQLPHLRQHTWHYNYPLDVAAMREGAKLLTGKHDFAAFCNFKRNTFYTNYERTLISIEIEELPEKNLCIMVQGDHFLYKMVRNIVGTLVYIGSGDITVKDLPVILENRHRPAAGITAPAHGLFLHTVNYN